MNKIGKKMTLVNVVMIFDLGWLDWVWETIFLKYTGLVDNLGYYNYIGDFAEILKIKIIIKNQGY